MDKAKALLDEKVAAAEKTAFSMPDIQKQTQMLQWAGISFGTQQTMLLQKSMKALAKLSGASSLKFFGKVYGISCDYWVVSGELPYVEEPAKDGQEKRGKGANSQIFWVTDNLLADWV